MTGDIYYKPGDAVALVFSYQSLSVTIHNNLYGMLTRSPHETPTGWHHVLLRPDSPTATRRGDSQTIAPAASQRASLDGGRRVFLFGSKRPLEVDSTVTGIGINAGLNNVVSCCDEPLAKRLDSPVGMGA